MDLRKPSTKTYFILGVLIIAIIALFFYFFSLNDATTYLTAANSVKISLPDDRNFNDLSVGQQVLLLQDSLQQVAVQPTDSTNVIQNVIFTQHNKSADFISSPPLTNQALAPSIFQTDGQVLGEQTFACSETDSGAAWSEAGVVSDVNGFKHDDVCISDLHAEYNEPNWLLEFSCDQPIADDNIQQTTANYDNTLFSTTYNCPHGCAAGQCLQEPFVGPGECVNTAGDIDFFTKGAIFDKNNQMHFDACHTYITYDGESRRLKTILNEYACQAPTGYANVYNGAGDYYRLDYDCPDGCANGACLGEAVPIIPYPGECVNTNGQIDYYSAGGIIGPDNKLHTDYCITDENNDGNPNHVVEYSCTLPSEDDRIVWVEPYGRADGHAILYNCPSGCDNGACIESSLNPTKTLQEFKVNYISYQKQSSNSNNTDLTSLATIKSLVEEYYPVIKELYGASQTSEATIWYNNNEDLNIPFLIYPQLNTIVLNNEEPDTVVLALLALFRGQYFIAMPQTWQFGTMYEVAGEVLQRFSGVDNPFRSSEVMTLKGQLDTYNNDQYPITGTQIFYDSDTMATLDRIYLAGAAWNKAIMQSGYSYKQMNEALYSISPDSSVWNNDSDLLVELGQKLDLNQNTISNWYNEQYVLHQIESGRTLGIFNKMKLAFTSGDQEEPPPRRGGEQANASPTPDYSDEQANNAPSPSMQANTAPDGWTPTSFCTDSDSGDDITTAGALSFTNGHNVPDSCEGTDAIWEGVCILPDGAWGNQNMSYVFLDDNHRPNDDMPGYSIRRICPDNTQCKLVSSQAVCTGDGVTSPDSEVDLVPVPASSPLTSSGSKNYHNQNPPFNISYPSDWTINQYQSANYPLSPEVGFKKSWGTSEWCELIITSTPRGTDFDGTKSNNRNIPNHTETVTTVAGQSATLITTESFGNEVKNYFFNDNGAVYYHINTSRSTTGSHAADCNTSLQQILESFKLSI